MNIYYLNDASVDSTVSLFLTKPLSISDDIWFIQRNQLFKQLKISIKAVVFKHTLSTEYNTTVITSI